MGVPAIADEICARYLAAVDDRHPDLLVGLYVVGSIALDDFRPGASDIDVVCVTRRPVTVADIAPVHAELGTASSRPFFDGVYVTADELAAPPAAGAKGVAVIEGKPIGESRAERHAVTWLTLARHGIGRRGPSPSEAWIHVDVAAARAHSRANLVDYWQPWVAAHRSLVSRAGLHSLTVDALVWSVLGVSRLHAMVAEGSILSKSAAGEYALRTFPQHRAIIEYAVAARHGERTPFAGGPLFRRRAMLRYLDDVIADALARPSA